MPRTISGAAPASGTTTSSLNSARMWICALALCGVALALGEETDTTVGRTPSILMSLDPPSDSSELGSGRSSTASPMPAWSLMEESPLAVRASVPV